MLDLPQLPSKTFGDGSHPTTRLCARAVDALCRISAPQSVLDVGTGTGILARIARRRGARFIVATDIDPLALAAAAINVRLDDASVPIELSPLAPDAWGPRFDLVVANILEAPLISLAPSLIGALAPSGVLLLSGFLPAQAPALRLAFRTRNAEMSELEGWALLVLRPRS